MSRRPDLGIVEGPILRAVVGLAWPVMVAESLQTLFQVVDMIWVGRLRGGWTQHRLNA